MSIEAMLSILAFFFLLGLFLNAATEQNRQAESAVNDFKALAEARKCSLIIDAVFANSGGIPETAGMLCYQQENGFVHAKYNGTSAKAILLAPSVFLSQQGILSTIEVKTNAHYK